MKEKHVHSVTGEDCKRIQKAEPSFPTPRIEKQMQQKKKIEIEQYMYKKGIDLCT